MTQDLNRRILIIDDNSAIHDDFRKILSADESNQDLLDAEAAFFGEADSQENFSLEIEIDSAYQGEEGYEKVKQAVADDRPYAMAFVDMRMPPGWDGLTTIERLWQVAPDLQVVICTAYSDNSWIDICQRLGVTDRLLILKKPFDNAEVCQLALSLTTKWNLARQAQLFQENLTALVEERTEQLKAREASLLRKQKLEAVGSLAGGVAHEFNNLLQSIRGYTRFAMDELPAEGQPYQDLELVLDAAQRASTITKQLLSFSRKEKARKTALATNDLIHSALILAKPILGETVQLHTELNDAGTIWGDSDSLAQAVLNLCINAKDAIQGDGQLWVTSEISDLSEQEASELGLAAGQHCLIRVRDDGCGIPEELQERVFEPFFTTKEVGKGTGMGLAMVFGMLQDHDGAIALHSAPEQGTTFTIYLPLADSNQTAGVTGSETNTAQLDGSGETVLIAEDEPMVRGVAVRALETAGYQVITAVDGEDALEKFSRLSNSISLAMLDVVMPKLNGHEVYRQIKQIKPDTKFLFCTGYDPDSVHFVADDNNTKTIHKPLTPECLVSAVRGMIQGEAQWNSP